MSCPHLPGLAALLQNHLGWPCSDSFCLLCPPVGPRLHLARQCSETHNMCLGSSNGYGKMSDINPCEIRPRQKMKKKLKTILDLFNVIHGSALHDALQNRPTEACIIWDAEVIPCWILIILTLFTKQWVLCLTLFFLSVNYEHQWVKIFQVNTYLYLAPTYIHCI